MFNMNNAYESNLQKTWYDSNMIPHLNSSNVLAYFTERSNPFYDKQCNNEIMKMQGFSPEKLQLVLFDDREMTGIEYTLLYSQEPILYIIRQQRRTSPLQATPIADFYIIAGIVYQAPDMSTLISSRLLNAVYSLGSAFAETQSNSRYHPSRGYWWEFKEQANQEKNKVKEKPVKDHVGTAFQRERIDALLVDFEQRFGVRRPPIQEKAEEMVKLEKQEKESVTSQNSSTDRQVANASAKQPEKRMKTMR